MGPKDLAELTKEEAFAEIERLVEEACFLYGNNAKTEEIGVILSRMRELTTIAKERGWL
jgi:hypothetical protein